MNGEDALLDEIINLKNRLLSLELRHFYTRELFGWVWWLGIACIIGVAVIWWKIIDKRRLTELFLFGLIVGVTSVSLDVIGSGMVLWVYPINIPVPIPILVPVDFFILPAVFSIIYQKCPAWGMYMLASAAAATLLSFGFEPFAMWIGQYKLMSWHLIYSFPVYIIIIVLAKFATERLTAGQAAAIGKCT